MNLEDGTSSVLRYGSVTGVIIIAAGLLALLLDMPQWKTVMTAGIAVTVFTPFIGMIVSFISLSVNKERKYAVSAFALIIITIIGMTVAYLLR